MKLLSNMERKIGFFLFSIELSWRYLRNIVVWTTNAAFYEMDARIKVSVDI
jgi:hypothetical protein